MIRTTVEIHDAGEPWDASDVRALLELIAKGYTQETAAERLGRTRAAVHSKLYRLRAA